MRILFIPPEAIETIENLWIPLADGCRLAARLWRPRDAETRPVPAILEYIPYRKRDFTRGRDEPMHAYFAAHGYAAIRVDMRGSGESDGLLLDEYLKQEQDDAVEIIAWIAAQSWCTGRVGMMGKSWGGFNALQVAARRPPALQAILTVCSTDDRYADDIHYMGGALLNDNLWWGSIMMAFNARPADPELIGAPWRDQWRERLESTPFFPALWLAHQRRDAYWRHGSVIEDFSAIQCPVYAVGGWADGYSNAIPRLLEGLRVPRKGLVGPWGHLYPHDGVPGPAIGFLQEAVKWWDQWLKGLHTGIMDEPAYRVWMQEGVPVAPTYATRPGRWVAEEEWPSPRLERRDLYLDGGRLKAAAPEPGALHLSSPQTVGLASGDWAGFGVPGEAPGDQRIDDAGSLVFDSAALSAPLEILGAPVVELELAADRPVAQLIARLSAVNEKGEALRVTYGILNLTHRASHAAPQELEPGRRYRIALALNDVAHHFPAGCRIRLGLSSAYWPTIWPSPEPVRLMVFLGASRLVLPVRPPREVDAYLRDLLEPESAPKMKATVLAPGQFSRRVTTDLTSGCVTMRTVGEGGVFGEGVLSIDAIDLASDHSITRELSIHPDDPLSADYRIEQSYILSRGDWRVRIRVRTRQWSTAGNFELEGALEAYEGETRIFARDWRETIARDLA